MSDETPNHEADEFQSRNGAIASRDEAVSVGRDGIYVGGGVGGDVLGAGARKVTITEETAYQVHGLPNPYLGLRSFTYEDRAAFAGRGVAVQQAVEKLTNPADPINLLFVTGASGSGKSSFVQAGLIPGLEAHYALRNKQVRHAVFRPSSVPLAILADALDQLGLPWISAEELAGFTSDGFNHYLSENTPRVQVNLLVVDQFEETFTQSELAQRERLFTFLTGLAPFSETNTFVIVTLRSDYLDKLFEQVALWKVRERGIELRAMSEDELKEAIQKPLFATGEQDERYKEKQFEPALLDRLAEDAAQDPAYLPLLQVTLQELWKGGSLKLERYVQLTDAIKQRAEKVYAFEDYDSATPERSRLASDQEEILKILTDLIEVSLDEDPRRDVRRRRVKSELVGDSIQRSRLVDSLVQARLLSVNCEMHVETQVDVVDIIHESLIANWARLSQAIAKQRNNLQRRARFEQALKEWEANEHQAEYLLIGVHLAEGRELESTGDIAMSSAEARQFLHSSIMREESTHRRRVRTIAIVAAGLAVALVMALVGIIIAIIQTNKADAQAQVSLAGQLAAQAQELLVLQSNLLPRAALLAIESLQRYPEKSGSMALADALQILPQPLSHITHDDVVNFVTVSPDGKWVASGSYDGTVWVWEAATGKKIAHMTHDGGVSSVAFSPDGKWVASGSYDGPARVWEAATGKKIAHMTHDGGVSSVAFSPDGKWVASGSYDGTVWVWEAATGKEIAHMTHDDTVWSVAFSPDGEWVISGSYDSTARVWVAATGKEVARMTHDGGVSSVAFSPDGERVVSGGCDQVDYALSCIQGTALVWEAATGKEIARMTHDGGVDSVAFSPGGERVVSGSDDGTARVWEAATGKEIARMTHDGGVDSVAFSPDGKWVASGSDDGTARVWEAASGKKIACMTHDDAVASVAFSPDGNWLASGSWDNTARVWKVASGQDIVRMTHDYGVGFVAFSPNGKWVVSDGCDQVDTITISCTQGTTRVWDAATRKEIARLTHDGGVSSVAFSPDGKWLASGGCDQVDTTGSCTHGTALVWEAATGKEIARMTHDGGVDSVAFSPDGERVVSGSDDGTARVWEAATGKEIARMTHDGGVDSVAFSPDGKWVVSGGCDQWDHDTNTCSLGTARVWEAATGKEIARIIHDGDVTSVAFSPDGEWVVSGSDDGTARVWEATTGKEIAHMTHDYGVDSVAFSPDGERVVSGSWDNTARVWEAATGKEIARMTYDEGVSSVAFSLDGEWVVSGSWDNTARVWEAASGKEISRIIHDGGVSSVAFSPDGERVVSGSLDGTARVWLWRPQDLIDMACSRLERNLTHDEWQQYLGDSPYRQTCPNLPPGE